jgi:hypothetical protein
MSHWDPIGVKDEPLAADEYDSYLGDLFELLVRQAESSEIEKYLRQVEIVQMGLSETVRATEKRAAAVRELQRTFHQQMLIE